MAKRKAAGAARRKKAARRGGASRSHARRAGSARKKAVRKPAARKTARVRKGRVAARQARRRGASAKQAKASVKQAKRSAKQAKTGAARKAPALNRERRIVRDDDLVPTPPSSLDLDRSASAARTGRRELHEKFSKHTETSPALTGGDVDADWESAYAVGDEAPGGDNPTPDQDIVDDIGKAVGVQYEDNEELKGEKKISDRDKKRWELDPASSEDYEDR